MTSSRVSTKKASDALGKHAVSRTVDAAPARKPTILAPHVPTPATSPADVAHPESDDEANSEVDEESNRQRSMNGGYGTTLMVKISSLTASQDKMVTVPITSLGFSGSSRESLLSATRLSDVRERLASVIREGSTYAFCSDEGAIAESEEITLEAYIRTVHEDFADDDVVHIFIAASNAPSATQLSALLKPPFMLKFIQMGDTPSDAINSGSLHSSSFQGKDPSGLPMGELRRMIGKMSASSTMHVFCSLDGSAAGDDLTLSQYLELDKEGVPERDGTPSIIIRYRKADAKVSAAASKFHGASDEVLAMMQDLKPDLTLKDHSGEEFKVDKTGFRVEEELSGSAIAAQDANPTKYTSQMDESDWDAVLRNCNLLYGWRINKKTNRVERATTPAFRLRNKTIAPTQLPQQPPAARQSQQQQLTQGSSSEDIVASTNSSVTSGSDKALTPTTSEAGSKETNEDDIGNDALLSRPSPAVALSAEDIASTIPTKLGAIPSFTINDQSKIQITTVSSEFQESMAKNHFESTSVEASVSGGYAGVSVGVSAGYASESSNKSVNTSKTFAKRMIGSYMFPRVTVFLRPEDLEPTPELRAALLLVQETKDIMNLRKLYATFGHLFCHASTLGGCLQTTKVVSGTQNTSDTEQKEAFKASLGVAVSTPVGVGGSVKTSHENSDSTANFKSQTNTSESMAFEATGGNSILAADPAAWSGSVADFNNWRVIDQAELSPIVDAIANMSGYSLVRQWFLSTVPKLSQYFVIPESRTLHVRFRLASQGDSFTRITNLTDQAYLGFDPSRPPKPVHNSLQRLAPEVEIHRSVSGGWFFPTVDLSYTTKQVDLHTTDALFFPHSMQAPVLMFPGGKEVGTSQDPRLMQTVWRLEVAQGYSLGPNSLVCVKSCAPVRASGDSDPQQAEIALTVCRNAQGVFVPAISNTDEPSYWRLRRISDTRTGIATSEKQEAFRHGESFRLTWSFSDQASGFRDWYNDIYGRRSYQRPVECPSDILCLKMPYPRFENKDDNSGISLVMSAALTSDPTIETLRVRRRADEGPGPDKDVSYNMFDLTFRMDYVGNDGIGDAKDFMNVITEAHEERRVEHRWDGQGPNPHNLLPFGSPEAMLAGVLLGPAALPIMGIGSLLGSIIGF